MPYAPTVNNMAGQIRGQGIAGAASTLANGFLQMQDKMDEDKKLLARAKSTESFIKAHSDLFGGDGVVKQVTSTDPHESPMERYSRLSQLVQDAVVGEKIQTDQQQRAAAEQQVAAQKFAMQEAQRKAQEEARQRAYLQQLAQFSGGAGIGVISPQKQAEMNTTIYGQPDGAMAVPAGSSPTLMQNALEMFKATGRVPSQGEISTLVSDMGRQGIADERSRSAEVRASDRAEAAQTVAAARAEAEQAKLAAKGAKPEFTQHPETGIWFVTQNGQTQAIPGQVAKDPSIAEIDRLEKAGDMTHAEAVAAKKKLFEHRSSFSPNGMASLAALFDPNLRQQMMQQPPQASGAFGPATPAAPAAPAAMSKPADYATEDDLVRAVEGGMPLDQAKAIAKQKGWKL